MSLAAVIDTPDVDGERTGSVTEIGGQRAGSGRSLAELNLLVASFAAGFAEDFIGMGQAELGEHLAGIEELSRTAEYLQVAAATAVDRSNAAAGGRPAEGNPSTGGAGFVFNTPDSNTAFSPSGDRRSVYRCTAEYLQDRLRISRSEATRRLRLGAKLLPRTTLTGDTLPAPLEHLAAAVSPSNVSASNISAGGISGSNVSGRSATLIATALDRARFVAEPAVLETMEAQLTTSATQYDPDFLTRLIRRWEAHLDPDGPEPTDKELAARQGVFVRGKKRGLHLLDIAATDEQYEYLTTVMNTTTNPRTQPCGAGGGGGAIAAVGEGDDGPHENGTIDSRQATQDEETFETRTRAQLLLDGLIGACQVALATDKLPATGGHRPQLLVTIDYKTLLRDVAGSTGIGSSSTASTGFSTVSSPDPILSSGASFAFTGPTNARTVRKLACDADIIPIVLGGTNEILDLGRTQRLFTVKQRKALHARDKGCAFPGCHMPSHWTEAHHITPWSEGGTTTTDNGVLLCSHHHHLIHQGDWTIEIKHHTPWFIPPKHVDPEQRPRRNRYWTLC
ncbi:HNH endonuclease signature motif containing protein [Arthrobacter tecti]